MWPSARSRPSRTPDASGLCMQPGEPLLIISHTFPPYRGIGGRRWAKLAKELARRGHPVHMVHADQGNDLKGSLWTDDIQRTGITSHALPLRYPVVLMKRPLTSVAEKLAYRFWLKVMPLLTTGNIFDRSVRWGPPLVAKCNALIAQHGIHTVIATAPPFALLHHLLAIKRDHSVKLVADFRDPWTWGPVYGRSTMAPERKAAEDRAEVEVMAGYDAVITPSPFILDHLRNFHPAHAHKVHLIEHIIDPDELGTLGKPQPDGRFRLIYAGSLYNADGFTAYFAEVLKAFVALQHNAPERWARTAFDVLITGHGTEVLRRMVRDADQGDRIRFTDPLPGRALFPMINRADLVLAYMPPEKRDFVSTKFNEVAYLRTPILHIGEPGGLSQHIVSNGLGATMRVDDISAQLLPVLTGERVVGCTGAYEVGKHLLPAIAEKLVRVVLS